MNSQSFKKNDCCLKVKKKKKKRSSNSDRMNGRKVKRIELNFGFLCEVK